LRAKVLDLADRGDPLLRLIKDLRISIVRPEAEEGCAVQINSLLDFSPVAVKVEGALGEGVTHLAAGVQMLLGAVDEGGFQPINGGAARGVLRDAVRFARPGTPERTDFMVHVDVLLKKGEGCTRQGIMAAHLACDEVAEEIRVRLRELDRYRAEERKKLYDAAKPGLFRVALVQSISGVGAMGDSALFPAEPGGFRGSSSIMDLTHNLPVFLTPNEYRDGIVHSLS
jgi:D-proline reductase (dithiol) PrdD